MLLFGLPLRRVFALIVFACGLLSAETPSKFQVIGYFTEGGAQSGSYTVKNVATSGAATMLTMLDYAFGRVADNQCQIANREAAINHSYTAAQSVDGKADPEGTGHLRGTFHQLQELKRRYP